MEINRFKVCFRLLSGIRWLIAGEGGITTSPSCIFLKYIRYSLHKTVPIIREYFSFNTGLRIGNTFLYVIVFAKVKTLHRTFPSLSSDSCIRAFGVGQSALNEGSELLLSTFGSFVHSGFSFFWKSLAVQKQNRKEFFPGCCTWLGQIVRFWQGCPEAGAHQRSAGRCLGISKILSFLAVSCFE